MIRTTVPPRCNKPAWWATAKGFYRSCAEHFPPDSMMGTETWINAHESGPDPWGPCDYPMDGLGAARYVKPQGGDR